MSARLFRMFTVALLISSAAVLTYSAAPQNPARWEKEIAAFEAEDQASQPPAQATLFVGSSSVRLWTNLARTFPDWHVIRRGFGGSHFSDLNFYFDRLVAKYEPKRIVVYAGENDLSVGRSPERVFEEFKTFVRKVQSRLPGAKIYYLSMKPSPSRWYLSPQINEGNARIRRYARFRSRVTYVDIATVLLDRSGRPNPALFEKDNLHVNAKGYELWARAIRRAVEG